MLLTTIYEMKLGGILLVGSAEPDTMRLLQSTKLPLVLIDSYVPGFSVDAVLTDNFEGARAKEALGYIAVKQLISHSADLDAASVTILLEVELIKRNSVISHKA